MKCCSKNLLFLLFLIVSSLSAQTNKISVFPDLNIENKGTWNSLTGVDRLMTDVTILQHKDNINTYAYIFSIYHYSETYQNKQQELLADLDTMQGLKKAGIGKYIAQNNINYSEAMNNLLLQSYQLDMFSRMNDRGSDRYYYKNHPDNYDYNGSNNRFDKYNTCENNLYLDDASILDSNGYVTYITDWQDEYNLRGNHNSFLAFVSTKDAAYVMVVSNEDTSILARNQLEQVTIDLLKACSSGPISVVEENDKSFLGNYFKIYLNGIISDFEDLIVKIDSLEGNGKMRYEREEELRNDLYNAFDNLTEMTNFRKELDMELVEAESTLDDAIEDLTYKGNDSIFEAEIEKIYQEYLNTITDEYLFTGISYSEDETDFEFYSEVNSDILDSIDIGKLNLVFAEKLNSFKDSLPYLLSFMNENMGKLLKLDEKDKEQYEEMLNEKKRPKLYFSFMSEPSRLDDYIYDLAFLEKEKSIIKMKIPYTDFLNYTSGAKNIGKIKSCGDREYLKHSKALKENFAITISKAFLGDSLVIGSVYEADDRYDYEYSNSLSEDDRKKNDLYYIINAYSKKHSDVVHAYFLSLKKQGDTWKSNVLEIPNSEYYWNFRTGFETSGKIFGFESEINDTIRYLLANKEHLEKGWSEFIIPNKRIYDYGISNINFEYKITGCGEDAIGKFDDYTNILYLNISKFPKLNEKLEALDRMMTNYDSLIVLELENERLKNITYSSYVDYLDKKDNKGEGIRALEIKRSSCNALKTSVLNSICGEKVYYQTTIIFEDIDNDDEPEIFFIGLYDGKLVHSNLLSLKNGIITPSDSNTYRRKMEQSHAFSDFKEYILQMEMGGGGTVEEVAAPYND